MSGIKIEPAERITALPTYLFASLDKMKQDAISKGIDIINLGVGDPDIPAPSNIVERLRESVKDQKNHQYPSYEGMLSFREAVASWYKRRFSVKLDPCAEVLTLIGSKEGIGHIPLAFINQGDLALVPDPGYPVYQGGTILAGGAPYFMPLLKENNFLPDLSAIPSAVAKKTKLMFLNYPNNPTSATASKSFFEETIRFARENDIIICHDAAYSEIYFNSTPPISFLEIEGAKDVGIEFHSLSKTYNMTGWRIGSAVGNKDIISCLGKVKSNIDSGVFQAVQEAGIEALTSDESVTNKIRKRYQERRDILIPRLKASGLDVINPSATFYIWIRVPDGYTSSSFTMHLLSKAGIVTTPGSGFGDAGEGYIRLSMTINKERLTDAAERIERIGW